MSAAATGTPEYEKAWYTIKNVAVGTFLSCSRGDSSASVHLKESADTANELWQFEPAKLSSDPQYILRCAGSDANGDSYDNEDYCVNAVYCGSYQACVRSPKLITCDNASLTVRLGLYYVGDDVWNTIFFEKYKYELAAIPGTSRVNFTDGSEVVNITAWDLSSVSDINDEHWSTFPLGLPTQVEGSSIPFTASDQLTTSSTTSTSSSITTTSYATTYSLPTVFSSFNVTGALTRTADPSIPTASPTSQATILRVCSSHWTVLLLLSLAFGRTEIG